MLFTSAAFIMFLAVLLVIYSVFPQKHRWFVLLVGSMTFYGFAGLHFLLYICATVVVTYLCTMRIRRLRLIRDALVESSGKEERRAVRAKFKSGSRLWTVICLVAILGILVVVKYTDFAITNANSILSLFGTERRIGFMRFALPMGISFYTFQTVGYVLDVYRETAAVETNPLKLALFVSFFPQIVQGPISRFGELTQTLFSGAPVNRRDLARGANRILWGFFKKLVIADRLWPALAVLAGSPEEFQGVFYFLSIGLYAVILFCDFTGGIDIAIGAAEIFGVRLPENFNRPFYSRSVQEYWQRWHMTMYSWFRDYLFYPIAASKRMLKLSKAARRVAGDNIGKRLPVHISLIIVWLLTGLWHGATWNFIVWGLANGVVLMISLELTPLYERFHGRFPGAMENRIYKCFQIFRTFWLMNMIRSFDIYDGVRGTLRMMFGAFTKFDISDFITRGVSELTLPVADYISAGAGLLVVFWISWLGRGEVDYRDRLGRFPWPLRYAVTGALMFAVLVFGAYGFGFDARQFVYNQF